MSIKREPPEVFVVPELEDIYSSQKYRPWTEEEKAIVQKYYKQGMARPISEYLAKHFPPGRSITAIRQTAERLGVSSAPQKEEKH